jgi:hypothetical protein
LKDRAAAGLLVVAAAETPLHPGARDAYSVWTAVAAAGFAPSQNPAVVTAAIHGGEPMLVAGFRAYASARWTGADLTAALVQADDAAVASMAWDEIFAVVALLDMSELDRADLADRLARRAPEAVRRALRLRPSASLQAVDSRLGVPLRARKALEDRRQRRKVILEALERLGQ